MVLEHIHIIVGLLLVSCFMLGTMVHHNTEGFKDSCDYSVNWVPDPDNFKFEQIKKNPFAKPSNRHCREDSQCQSGKCNQWYCEPVEESEFRG